MTFGVVMVHAFVQSTDGQGLLSIPYSHIALYAAIAVGAALAAADSSHGGISLPGGGGEVLPVA